jgi:hypothetical protein
VNFRDWLIAEMAHLALPYGVPIGGRLAKVVDMKFETYPDDLKKNIFLWMQSFAAKLPDGRWLIHKWGSPTSVTNFPPSDVPKVPNNWIHYAEIIYDNEVTPYAVA